MKMLSSSHTKKFCDVNDVMDFLRVEFEIGECFCKIPNNMKTGGFRCFRNYYSGIIRFKFYWLGAIFYEHPGQIKAAKVDSQQDD